MGKIVQILTYHFSNSILERIRFDTWGLTVLLLMMLYNLQVV